MMMKTTSRCLSTVLQRLLPAAALLLLLLLLAAPTITQGAFNPADCPISLAGAAGAPSCTLAPGGQLCDPATQVFCQYLTGQPTTVDYCCSLAPANPSKPQRRLCLKGCDAAHKAERRGCTRGQAGYKSCELVAKAKLNDCKGFCFF